MAHVKLEIKPSNCETRQALMPAECKVDKTHTQYCSMACNHITGIGETLDSAHCLLFRSALIPGFENGPHQGKYKRCFGCIMQFKKSKVPITI